MTEIKTVQEVRVWDSVVRLFHWSLVSVFFVVYVSGEDWLGLHAKAGYFILGLLTVRFVWGFVGSRYARFDDFIYKPSEILSYLKDVTRLRARRYLGHNPAGGAMIVVVLLSLLITSVTGLMAYTSEESTLGGLWQEILEETHEGLANLSVFLVFVHLIGVLIESLLHDENLIRAMVTGRKVERP